MAANTKSLSTLPARRRWRQQAVPARVVLALIRRHRVADRDEMMPHYLLIQRQSESYLGQWGLVGGIWEFGETLDAAITREVKEETGLDAEFVALRGVIDERIAPLGPDDEGCHFLLFVRELSAPAGEAREQSEGPVAWFSPEQLKELRANQQVVSTDYAILEHLSKTALPLQYIEATVVASKGANTVDRLVRFETIEIKLQQ